MNEKSQKLMENILTDESVLEKIKNTEPISITDLDDWDRQEKIQRIRENIYSIFRPIKRLFKSKKEDKTRSEEIQNMLDNLSLETNIENK